MVLSQIKSYKQCDGSTTYDIHGKSEEQCREIYLALCDKYKKVTSYVGRYIGTAEYYGYFQCI